MTQVDRGMEALLAAILDMQHHEVTSATMTQERIVEALTQGPGFTGEERRLLWLSPDARNTYLAIKKQLVRTLESELRESGIEMEIAALAAGAGDGDVLIVEGKDWSVVLQRDEGDWTISLRLGSAFRARVPPMAVVRLVDDGGLEWLSGRLDEHGEINTVWTHPDMSPHVRCDEHRLRLDLG